MTQARITKAVAQKVLDLVDLGLTHGMGKPEPGKMCVEAVVKFALGEGHGDDPSCVSNALRRLKIRLNDSAWSSDKARAKGMRRLALIQLGSAGHLDEKEFAKRVARLAIQTSVPVALRAAASIAKGTHKDKLLNAADLCERDPTQANALEAKSVARAAAAAAYADAAAYAADAYAADAAAAAADAAAYAYAAADADADAYAAAAADAAYAAAYAAAAAIRDKHLAAFAEGVVQILIELEVPGVKWLALTEGGEEAA